MQYCDQCGAPNREQARFCRGCGEAIVALDDTAAERVTGPPAASQEDQQSGASGVPAPAGPQVPAVSPVPTALHEPAASPIPVAPAEWLTAPPPQATPPAPLPAAVRPGPPVVPAASAPSPAAYIPTPSPVPPSEITGPPETGEDRRIVSVVFCDVVGSTDIGERLDPEAVRVVMGRYFDAMSATISRHGGLVEKFIGDAVMAAFGIPELHEDDAVRAVRAADEMQQAMAELNEELESVFGVRVMVRIGVNTGPVVAGDHAAGERFVTGDTVNVAARFEQAAGAGEVIIGEPTYRLVRDAVRVEPLEPLTLKGKSEPIPAWRLLSVSARAAGLSRHLDSPIVGREHELSTLRTVYSAAVDSRSLRLATVLGTAGTGKSRLTKEFLAALPPGTRVLWGHCLPYGDGITYWPIAEIVRAAAGIDSHLSLHAAMGRIRALLPEGPDNDVVAERIAGAVGLVETTSSAEEIVWAVRRLLEALASAQPLVLVIDDIHWAESTLLDLLIGLCSPPAKAPVMVVCTTRPDLLDEQAGWVESSGAVMLRLMPLDQHEVGLLIKNLLGETSLGPDTQAQIIAAAEGNPLFVEEMLRMLVDDGLLARDHGRWVAIGDLSEVAVPPSVELLLRARLDRLAPAERAVLQRAAVIGRTFYADAVADLSPPEARDAIPRLLASLLRRQLIDREPDQFFAGEEAYRFNHILSRDAAYESVPKLRRVPLHETFARWLEARAGDRLGELEEVVGYHLEQSFLYQQSLTRLDDSALALGREASARLASAAYRARMRGDVSGASGLVGRAMLLLPESDPVRLDLACQLGSDLLALGELDRAGGVLEETLAQAGDRGVDELSARVAVELAFLHIQIDPTRVMAEIPEVAASAERAFIASRDERGLARVWQLRGERDWTLCHFADNTRALERGLVHARRAGDQLLESELLTSLGSTLCWGPTPVGEAVAWAEEMLAGGVRIRRVECGLLGILAYLNAMRGDFDVARELAARSRAMLEDLGLSFVVAARSGPMSEIEYLAGDVVAAEAELQSAYDVLAAVEERGVLPTIAANLAHMLVAQERYEDALRYTEISEGGCDEDDVLSQVSWRSARAKARAWEGRHVEAEALAREAVRLAAGTDCLHVHGSALLDLARVLGPSRATEAQAAVREALALFERKEHAVLAAQAWLLLD